MQLIQWSNDRLCSAVLYCKDPCIQLTSSNLFCSIAGNPLPFSSHLKNYQHKLVHQLRKGDMTLWFNIYHDQEWGGCLLSSKSNCQIPLQINIFVEYKFNISHFHIFVFPSTHTPHHHFATSISSTT